MMQLALILAGKILTATAFHSHQWQQPRECRLHRHPACFL